MADRPRGPGGTYTMESKAVHGRVLGDYVAVVRRRWLVVLVALLVCFAAGLAFLQVAPKTYVSSAKVLVLPPRPSRSPRAAGPPTASTSTPRLSSSSPSRWPCWRSGRSSPRRSSSATSSRSRWPVGSRSRCPRTRPSSQIEYAGSTPEKAQAGAQAFAEAYLTYRRDSADQTVAERNRDDQRPDRLAHRGSEPGRRRAGLGHRRPSVTPCRANAQRSTPVSTLSTSSCRTSATPSPPPDR